MKKFRYYGFISEGENLYFCYAPTQDAALQSICKQFNDFKTLRFLCEFAHGADDFLEKHYSTANWARYAP